MEWLYRDMFIDVWNGMEKRKILWCLRWKMWIYKAKTFQWQCMVGEWVRWDEKKP